MHVFQTFWWGAPLTPYEAACLKSFVDRGHRIDLYSYDRHLEVPAGVWLRDASEILGYSSFFTYEGGLGKGSPAAFANLFRYKLLHERGGWWIDTDVLCLAPEIPAVDTFFAWQQPGLVNNAVICFPAGHPAMRLCFERAAKLGRSVQWGQAGPTLLTEVLTELGLASDARPASSCYPVSYAEALDVLRPAKAAAISERHRTSVFLHLWNEILRRNEIDRHCLPPRGSALRTLFDAVAVSGWTGEYNDELLERDLSLRQQLATQTAQMTQLEQELEQLRARLASVDATPPPPPPSQADDSLRQDWLNCTRERDQLACQLDALLGSTTWRATAPLRRLVDGMRGLVGAGGKSNGRS